MKKRTSCLCLVLFLTLSLALSAAASAPTGDANVPADDGLATLDLLDSGMTLLSDITESVYKSDITALYNCGALAGLLDASGNFHPNELCTQNAFSTMLRNLFPKRNVTQASWFTHDVVTQSWATSTMHNVSVTLGHSISWSGGSPTAKVTRAKACALIVKLLNCDNRFLWSYVGDSGAVEPNTPPTDTTPPQNSDQVTMANVLYDLWTLHQRPAPNTSWESWAKSKGLLPDDLIDPTVTPCTKAYLAWAIWQLAGSPNVAYSYYRGFTDVSSSASYRVAVGYVLKYGIMCGKTSSTFSPNELISQQDLNAALFAAYGPYDYLGWN